MTQEIQAKIDAVKAPFIASAEAADAIPALVDAREQAKYDEGFAAGEVSGIQKGKDMIELPSPTLPDGTVDETLRYTQEQMDSAVRSGMEQKEAEMQIKVNELVAKVAELEAAAVAKPGELEAAVKAAVDARTAEIVAGIEDADVDNKALVAKYKI